MCIPSSFGLRKWCSDKESACQCRRYGFHPWVRKIPWSRKWQPTPVFLPGELHGQRSLLGYSPWGGKESDMTEHVCVCTHTHTHTHTHLLPLCCGWQSPENIARRSQNSSQESWMDDDRVLYTKKYSNPCAYTKAFSFILTTYMSSPVSLIRKSFSIEWHRGQSHLVLTTYHALLKQPSSPRFFRMVLTSPSPPPTAVGTCRLPRAPTRGLLKENPCSRVTPCPAPSPPPGMIGWSTAST